MLKLRVTTARKRGPPAGRSLAETISCGGDPQSGSFRGRHSQRPVWVLKIWRDYGVAASRAGQELLGLALSRFRGFRVEDTGAIQAALDRLAKFFVPAPPTAGSVPATISSQIVAVLM